MWANACDVFHRMPARVGRGRRAAVNFVVFWVGGQIFPRFFFFVFFFFERTRPDASMRPPRASFTSLLVQYDTKLGAFLRYMNNAAPPEYQPRNPLDTTRTFRRPL